jgi:nitroimidazol reductase NimA-like FMN-containing flavoprotein (pyridoxamine 5'-phosphate oxidase superfamily)
MDCTMTMHDGRSPGIFDEESCLALLGRQPVGRLGFSAGGLPVVYPVHYALDDRTIVFRSEPGQKIQAAEHRAVACLEIDHFHRGDSWTVLATGRLGIAQPGRAERMAHLLVSAGNPNDPDWFVEMPIEMLSGRSVGPLLSPP